MSSTSPVFELYIDDDRYAVPSLYLITAPDEPGARAQAVELWGNSRHHLGVEVLRDGEAIFALGSMARRASAALDKSGKAERRRS